MSYMICNNTRINRTLSIEVYGCLQLVAIIFFLAFGKQSYSQELYSYTNLAGVEETFSSLSAAEGAMRSDHGAAGQLLVRQDPTSSSPQYSASYQNVFTFRYGVPEQPTIEYSGFTGWRLGIVNSPYVPDFSVTQATFGSYSAVRSKALQHTRQNHTPVVDVVVAPCDTQLSAALQNGVFFQQVHSGGILGISDPTVRVEWIHASIFVTGTVHRYDPDFVTECEPEGSNYAVSYDSSLGFSGYFAFTCPDGLGAPTPNDQQPAGQSSFKCTYEHEPLITAVSSQHCGGKVVGNPCDPITGRKTQTEEDYVSPTLTLERNYSSALQSAGMSPGWTHNHQSRLFLNLGDNPSHALRPDGQIIQLADTNDQFDGTVFFKFVSVGSDGLSIEPIHIYSDRIHAHRPDGTVEKYDKDEGLIREVISPSGHVTTYEYVENTGAIFQERALLDRVLGPFGHELDFHYDPVTQQLMSVDTPDGPIAYAYDAIGNLDTVTYPDNTTRRYFYEDANHNNYLTGIENELGTRYANFGYHSNGRASFTERTGGYQRFDMSDGSTGSVIVTDAKAEQTTYDISSVGEAQIPMLGDWSDVDGSQSRLFDSFGRGRKSVLADELGHETRYDYDIVHTTAVHEGAPDSAGSPIRSTFYENYLSWKNDLAETVRQTSVSSNPSHWKTTQTTYGSDLLPDDITVTGYKPDGSAIDPRITAIKYYLASDNVTHVIGKLKEIDGPRVPTDVDDRVLFEWYDCDTGTQCSQLSKITQVVNAGLSLETTFDLYDAAGRLKQFTDPNGLETFVVYDTRGRLKSVERRYIENSATIGRTTSYDYYDNGLLERVDLPSGGYYEYFYDDAEQLREVHDAIGNHSVLTPDLKGNPEVQEYFSNENGMTDELVYSAKSEFDQRDRLVKITGALTNADAANGTGIESIFGYSADGEHDLFTDGESNDTVFRHDSLGRVKEIVDALNGEAAKTEITLDVNDMPTLAKAPNGAQTIFEYDDFGNVISEQSPDRGVRHYEYDEADNLISITYDLTYVSASGASINRPVTVILQYDAINRLEQISYPDQCRTVIYTYDSGTDEEGNALQYVVGRLASIDDHFSDSACASIDSTGNTGVETYSYNGFGEVVRKGRKVHGIPTSVSYTYDDLGNISTMTYPSGRVVTYHRDGYGDVTGVDQSTNANGIETLLSNVAYDTTGVLLGYDYGNGLSLTRSYDLQLRLTNEQLTDGVTDKVSNDFDHDDVGNIELIDDLTTSNLDRDYMYDVLYRLDYATQDSFSLIQDFEYDANGNRTTLIDTQGFDGANDAQSHSIEANSNRLLSHSSTNGGAVVFQFDSAGNRVKKTDAVTTDYYYDDSGRLHRIEREGEEVGRYVYNALGQRVQKLTPTGGVITYYYNERGQLIAEADINGVIAVEYIYLEDHLIAIAGSDRDGDGVRDEADNCVLAPNPNQINTNSGEDPFGNQCDADVNNDNIVNFIDYNDIAQRFLAGQGDPNYDEDADFNSDGVINFLDMAIYQQSFLQTPGPAGSNTAATDLSVTFVYSDYLATPVKMFDETGVEIWAAEREPFGARRVEDDVDGGGSPITLNVGFPGQYYDSESSLFYNYHRYYDPATGRYIASDPIGLTGGLQTYSYATQNPIRNFDPFGLLPQDYWAAEELVREVAEQRGISTPDTYGIGLSRWEEFAGATGSTSPPWKTGPQRVTITEKYYEKCINNEDAQTLLKAYFHETLHYDGPLLDALLISYASKDQTYDSGRQPGDLIHDWLADRAQSLANEYMEQYNLLRFTAEGIEKEIMQPSCTCQR